MGQANTEVPEQKPPTAAEAPPGFRTVPLYLYNEAVRLMEEANQIVHALTLERDALKEAIAKHEEYRKRNPLGGPAQLARAQRERDEARRDAADATASKLIDAWVADKGKKIPWAKAVQIVAIVTKQSDAERDRLLRLGDEDGRCETAEPGVGDE